MVAKAREVAILLPQLLTGPNSCCHLPNYLRAARANNSLGGIVARVIHSHRKNVTAQYIHDLVAAVFDRVVAAAAQGPHPPRTP